MKKPIAIKFKHSWGNWIWEDDITRCLLGFLKDDGKDEGDTFDFLPQCFSILFPSTIPKYTVVRSHRVSLWYLPPQNKVLKDKDLETRETKWFCKTKNFFFVLIIIQNFAYLLD